jgi:polar amino acid transport system substrate-binding protein
MRMRALAFLVALVGSLALASMAGAQEGAQGVGEAPSGAGTENVLSQPAAGFPRRELIIGTKEAPPFAMKDADGSWIGISIELWRDIAQKLGVTFRLVEEPSVQALIDATARGRYDLSVAAITITPERERSVDFSQPFYATGLGIAVAVKTSSVWSEVARTMASTGLLQAVGALIGISLLVGVLVWMFERRHNDDFGGSAARGLGASIWWSAEAMTQASTGHRGPKTFAGRVLAIIWMVTSILAIAVFTASVTSSLTTREMRGLVHGVGDLPAVRVGAVAGSATIGYLEGQRIRHRNFNTAQDGLRALEAGSIDAFVYDKPLLAWIAARQFPNSIEVLDVVFDPQSYGIAMPNGSAYREDIDVAILEAIRGDRWKETLFRYLGEKR